MKEDIFPLTSSPTLFLPRSVDKRSCSISQIRRGPLLGSTSQITNHALISKAKLHITVTIMRVERKLWVFIKFIYAPLRMKNSHQTVSPFPSTWLFCKCDQAECGPRGADAIKGIPVTHHPTTTVGS